MSRRYGKLPSELMGLSIFDFDFNVKIMNRAIDHENMNAKKARAEQKTKSRFRKFR
jgi:hypothetical protein